MPDCASDGTVEREEREKKEAEGEEPEELEDAQEEAIIKLGKVLWVEE